MVRTNRSQQAKAFTLIELLVVIAIITLLISIVVPSFGRFKDMAKSTVAQSRVVALNGACELYFNTYHMYPGQDTNSLTRLDPGGAGHLTGTQVLLRALLDFDVSETNSASWTRRSNPRNLIDLTVADLTGTDWSTVDLTNPVNITATVDHYTKEMPILYFPARLAVSPGVANIYKESDNDTYFVNGKTSDWGEPEDNVAADPDAKTKTNFVKFITNPAAGIGGSNVAPYREDSYLIIGAGIDRKYFSTDDNANFNFRQ